MNAIRIPPEFLAQIRQSGEASYPEEAAGFLLGRDGDDKIVMGILPLRNAREEASRRRRYLISPAEYQAAESTADRLGLNLIGVFHSHPDHPSEPSEYDREWAQPTFSYVITSVRSGEAVESRSWLLAEDRMKFIEETIQD